MPGGVVAAPEAAPTATLRAVERVPLSISPMLLSAMPPATAASVPAPPPVRLAAPVVRATAALSPIPPETFPVPAVIEILPLVAASPAPPAAFPVRLAEPVVSAPLPVTDVPAERVIPPEVGVWLPPASACVALPVVRPAFTTSAPEDVSVMFPVDPAALAAVETAWETVIFPAVFVSEMVPAAWLAGADVVVRPEAESLLTVTLAMVTLPLPLLETKMPPVAVVAAMLVTPVVAIGARAVPMPVLAVKSRPPVPIWTMPPPLLIVPLLDSRLRFPLLDEKVMFAFSVMSVLARKDRLLLLAGAVIVLLTVIVPA